MTGFQIGRVSNDLDKGVFMYFAPRANTANRGSSTPVYMDR
jgi:hypothetical protein